MNHACPVAATLLGLEKPGELKTCITSQIDYFRPCMPVPMRPNYGSVRLLKTVDVGHRLTDARCFGIHRCILSGAECDKNVKISEFSLYWLGRRPIEVNSIIRRKGPAVSSDTNDRQCTEFRLDTFWWGLHAPTAPSLSDMIEVPNSCGL